MREMPDPYVLAFLLVIGVLLLLFYSRLLAAVRGGALCIHGLNGTQEMLGNKYICDSVRIELLLLVPFYALTLVVAGVSQAGYWWTLAALFAFLLLRKIVISLMGWLGSRQAAFRAVERTGYTVAVLVMLASVPALLVGWLVPEAPRWLLWVLLALPPAAGLFIYYLRGRSLLLQTEFSSFFWVLYLCGLEILPICVVVNRLINGN